MNLAEHYNRLYDESIHQIESDHYEIDSIINLKEDWRFGITLLTRPNAIIKEKIEHFLSDLQKIEPNQYYYPESDLHITILSIISCYTGFKDNQININDYIEIIRKNLANIQPFSITFRGITASPSCIMVQGFYHDDTLNSLRNSLRKDLLKSGLQQSVDQRYLLQTAHSTVVRFKHKLQHKSKFIQLLNNYRDFDFGTFEVDKLELVYNDWYQRKETTKKLHIFEI